MPIKDRTRIFEVAAIITTGIGKFVFVDLYDLKIYYIVVACVSWMAYIGYRSNKDKNLLEYFGFRKAGFRSSLNIILPISIISLVGFVVIGLFLNKLVLSWHIIPILLLYPIWGTIQQFLMVSLLATHLSDYEGRNISNLWIIIIISVLFSTVHYPSTELIIGTFFLAILYTIVFLRYRNIWVLGIFHGWLGCFFYFFVLGRDPLAELFQSI